MQTTTITRTPEQEEAGSSNPPAAGADKQACPLAAGSVPV